nr:NBS-LRR disease resistance protein [Dasypyrum villosum]
MDRILVSASTGAMNSVLGKLANLMGEEFAKLKNLRKEVKFVSDELASMKDALEGLSYLDELDPQTKRWRDIVREMSYDIEEIIDDFMQNIGGTDKSDGFVSSTIRRLKTLRARHRIARQIEDVKKLVLETSARRQRYKIDTSSSSNVAIDPRVATLYENAANLVGVEEPTSELINLLRDGEKKLKVVSIVGFGGLGKTTLASVVHGKLKGEFSSCTAFVLVSQKPDIPKLLRGLLSQLGVEPSIHARESHLIDMLREHLKNERYLIIIDDIWDVSAWDIIKCAFPENYLGSRVITTTRIQVVAKACCLHGHDHIIEMKPLNDKDSRRLFFGRIFGSEEACPRHLRDVSVEILKKCGGLPLAIVTISSMLASEDSIQIERWENVRSCLGSLTNLTLEGVRQILNLSYRDLPLHLKTCLLYLGMYPEDYIISRYDLERQWTAEGFAGKENGQDSVKIASNYFNELVNRSLIQPVKFDSRGSVTKCRIHDMMLDLILLKSTEENFFTIVDDPRAITGLDYKIRRLSIHLDSVSNSQAILPKNNGMSHVRSVMFFGSSESTPDLLEFKFLRVLFINLRRAKVDLSGLSKLYQLRYLRISRFCLHQLPTQIRMLQHLQTLDLGRYSRYSNIPSDIVHLPHLMHLNVGSELFDGISNMKSLRHLCAFDLAVNSIDNIKNIGELTNLRYLFMSCGPHPDDTERRMDVLRSSLGKLCNLEDLIVSMRGCIDGLMPLSPPATPYRLERLVMFRSCWFSRIPSWIGELRNLGVLQLQVCELLNDGVGILSELPVLIHLDIDIRRAVNKMIVICAGRGAFPALKRFYLQISSVTYLDFQPGVMPKLQRLEALYNMSESDQNGDAPAGIEHLLALEELSAAIGCEGATEATKRSTESALRSAINMHPSHPRVTIRFFRRNLKFFPE